MGRIGNCSIRGARSIISGAVIAALFSANVQAAMLANMEGVVSVNQGNGFQPASIGSSLEPGARIRTESGSANIVYENGCSTRIGPFQAVAVLASPPSCNGAVSLKGGPVDPGLSTQTLLLGGLVAGGAVGLAVALSSNNNNHVSP